MDSQRKGGNDGGKKRKRCYKLIIIATAHCVHNAFSIGKTRPQAAIGIHFWSRSRTAEKGLVGLQHVLSRSSCPVEYSCQNRDSRRLQR